MTGRHGQYGRGAAVEATPVAAVAVTDRMCQGLAIFRVVVLVNAVGLDIYRADNFHHRVAGGACVLLMIVWTGVAIWAYAAQRRRRAWLLVADLAIAMGVLAATPWVKEPGFHATVPGYWIAGALMAWAICYRWPGGLLAGVLLAGLDLSLREDVRQSDYGSAFLLVIAGAIVGFLVGSLQQMAIQRDQAERQAAVATERARLGRVVHDGVLQALALVQRRGTEIGGETAELANLAGEQERVLRALIHEQDSVVEPGNDRSIDLAAELLALERIPGVTVAAPGSPVRLAPRTATELVAAVRACLDNVHKHVGTDAPAWVLLEADDVRVEISVRDEGPGIASGRLEEAAAQGRLGAARSIRGRVEDLGGSARLVDAPGGTEWEFTLPREPAGPAPA